MKGFLLSQIHFFFFFTKILCFIYFLCIGIDLVPQKTLIQKVQFKLWKNNPGPQSDTASWPVTAVVCVKLLQGQKVFTFL